MCAKPALLYAAPVWAAAAKTHIKKLQIVQNKFLRIIYNPPIYTKTADLHQQLIYIDMAIAEVLSNALKPHNSNPLISNIFNYKLKNIPFYLRCRIPLQFAPNN